MPEPSRRVRLCASADLADGATAFVFDLLEWGRPVRGFAQRAQGRVVAYLNRCAHVPMEMDWQPGVFLDSSKRWILCSTHGAAYDPGDGRCVAGPCGRGRLLALDVAESDGAVYWYPSGHFTPVSGD
jgi:nitrite reductase/ring-hydroxylating ferredoxin subunit